jgi:hypothetical protein
MQALVGLFIVICIAGAAYQSLSPEAQAWTKLIGLALAFVIVVQLLGATWVALFGGPKKTKIRTNRGPVLADGICLTFEIDYTDAAGCYTSRQVDIQSITGSLHRDGTITLYGFSGYCHLRKDVRNFLFSRVRSAGDPETGEIIEDFQAVVAYEAGRRETVR